MDIIREEIDVYIHNNKIPSSVSVGGSPSTYFNANGGYTSISLHYPRSKFLESKKSILEEALLWFNITQDEYKGILKNFIDEEYTFIEFMEEIYFRKRVNITQKDDIHQIF